MNNYKKNISFVDTSACALHILARHIRSFIFPIGLITLVVCGYEYMYRYMTFSYELMDFVYIIGLFLSIVWFMYLITTSILMYTNDSTDNTKLFYTSSHILFFFTTTIIALFSFSDCFTSSCGYGNYHFT
jgi:hypothetical protein